MLRVYGLSLVKGIEGLSRVKGIGGLSWVNPVSHGGTAIPQLWKLQYFQICKQISSFFITFDNIP